jgi:hypothetical protein
VFDAPELAQSQTGGGQPEMLVLYAENLYAPRTQPTCEQLRLMNNESGQVHMRIKLERTG